MRLKKLVATILTMPFLIACPVRAYDMGTWVAIVQPGWDGPPQIRVFKSSYAHCTIVQTPDLQYVMMAPQNWEGPDTIQIRQNYGQPTVALMQTNGRIIRQFDGIWGGPWRREGVHKMTAQEARSYLGGQTLTPGSPPSNPALPPSPPIYSQHQSQSWGSNPVAPQWQQRQPYGSGGNSRGAQPLANTQPPPDNTRNSYAAPERSRNVSLASGTVSASVRHNKPTVRALFIAADTYKDSAFPALSNPVTDARAIAAELNNNYQCQCEVLANPTVEAIVSKLREYAQRTYSDDDELLVFFAGHGLYDPIDQMGYLVEANSDSKDITKRTMLSAPDLLTRIGNIKCKHILVCLDVCHAGTFVNFIASQYASSRGANVDTRANLDAILDESGPLRTRKLFVSSLTRSASDGRPGDHSPFAKEFLHALREDGRERGFLTLTRLGSNMQEVVPGSKTFCLPTDDEGEFFFVHH